MKLTDLSARYAVRRLDDSDADRIYDLCCGNTFFYRYHPPVATRESILKDMRALPPNKGYDDKFYIGFFQHNKLAAVMDLIRDYPGGKMLFIGFFMVDSTFQGKGIGTGIISECCAYWKNLGYQKVRLGVDKGNPQSSAFWKKNGFIKIGEAPSNTVSDCVLMERAL